MKQAVIFDMDGVLVDTENFYFKRRMKFFDELKIEPASRKIQDFVGLTNEMIWERLIPNDEKKRKILREKYVDYSKEHEVCFSEVLNTSVKEVFRKLKDKNIKIAIASSSEKKDILRMIKECELNNYIDFVISGEECAESKPNPEIYIKAVKALDLLETEALAVEDSVLGIRAAKLAGLTVGALVQKDYYIDQSEADYKMNDLIQLIAQI
ncbi:HAD family hydrolase [Pelosinus baikalensis]|uniref:HAD family phosphatase n=1 Tax=Pelosinus baikalensis TaxID=2892015 RepID=A0ABS8HUT4_9FIRM|nr:HAD family phosphatase [Pelosinus baikalensis]MCC5466910.1 HAD family phosphatase [Pelosinus baikalensis]